MAGTPPPPESWQENQQKSQKYYSREEFCVVREQSGREEVKCQLECALEKEYRVVIVDPPWLGDQAIRWIRFGNFLHKTAVISCLAGLVCVPVVPHRLFHYISFPLGATGVLCVALYDVSWQFDPCCKYQVDHDGHELTHVPSHELHSSSPVVLVFRNDKYRKRLHNVLAIATLALLGWKVYRSFYS